jgi:ATP-dependent Lon protease
MQSDSDITDTEIEDFEGNSSNYIPLIILSKEGDSKDEPPKKRGRPPKKSVGNSKNDSKKRKGQASSPVEDPIRIIFNPFMNIPSGNEDDGYRNNQKTNKTDTLKERVLNSGMDKQSKENALAKLKSLTVDRNKNMEWFESLLRIPFGKYSKLPVSKDDDISNINEYFDDVVQKLDEAVYGMNKAKEEIINYVAQFISTDNKSSPRVIGLHGAAGVGKTSLIRRGLSNALRRPMKCFSLGGAKDSSHYVGFSVTYSNSRYGGIARSLMDMDVMDGIFFFDELDKVGGGKDGEEIQNLLIHLTDPVQNHNFEDKYFDGINIDLSKIIFIFSFNNIEDVSPILKDRLHIINIPTPSLKEKIVIGQKYLLKELMPNIGLELNDIIFSEEIIKYIVEQYCQNDTGIRNLKRSIETILLCVNTARYVKKYQKYKTLKDMKLPLIVTVEIVNEILYKSRSIRDELISSMFM